MEQEPTPAASGLAEVDASPRRLRRIVIGTAGALSVLYVITKGIWALQPRRATEILSKTFDLNLEDNIPNLFSGFVLFATGWFAWQITRYERRAGNPAWRGWAVVMLGLVYLSFDEWFAIHERTLFPLRRALDVEGGAFYQTWVVAGIAAVVVLGPILLLVTRSLTPRTRRRLIVAGAVFVAAAIGGEMVHGAWLSATGTAEDAFVNVWFVLPEEFGEYLGSALALYAVADHLADLSPRLHLVLRDTPDG